MFDYENGLLLAFILWVFGVIRVIIMANSRTQKNLKTIGKRLSYNLGVIVDINYVSEPKMWTITKFILIHVLLPLPFILLSWIYVIFVVGSYLYVYVKDFGAPVAIKEFRWKLRNVDLTFDQMIKELMKISEQDPMDFDTVKQEISDDIRQRKSLAFKAKNTN